MQLSLTNWASKCPSDPQLIDRPTENLLFATLEIAASDLPVQFKLRKRIFIENSIKDYNFPKILQIGKKSIQCP